MAPMPNVQEQGCQHGDFYTPGIDAKLERVKPFYFSHINKSS